MQVVLQFSVIQFIGKLFTGKLRFLLLKIPAP